MPFVIIPLDDIAPGAIEFDDIPLLFMLVGTPILSTTWW